MTIRLLRALAVAVTIRDQLACAGRGIDTGRRAAPGRRELQRVAEHDNDEPAQQRRVAHGHRLLEVADLEVHVPPLGQGPRAGRRVGRQRNDRAGLRAHPDSALR